MPTSYSVEPTLCQAIGAGVSRTLPPQYLSYVPDLIHDGWLKAERWKTKHQAEIEFPATFGFRLGVRLALSFLDREKRRAVVSLSERRFSDSEEMAASDDRLLSDHGDQATTIEQSVVLRELVGHLTPRQAEILPLLGDGLKQKEIAGVLHLAESTVSKQVRSIERRIKSLLRTPFDPTDPPHRPPTGPPARRRGGTGFTTNPGGTMHRKPHTGKCSLLDTPIPWSLVDQALRLVLQLPGFAAPCAAPVRDTVKDFATILKVLGFDRPFDPALQLAAKKPDVERVVLEQGIHASRPAADAGRGVLVSLHCRLCTLDGSPTRIWQDPARLFVGRVGAIYFRFVRIDAENDADPIPPRVVLLGLRSGKSCLIQSFFGASLDASKRDALGWMPAAFSPVASEALAASAAVVHFLGHGTRAADLEDGDVCYTTAEREPRLGHLLCDGRATLADRAAPPCNHVNCTLIVDYDFDGDATLRLPLVLRAACRSASGRGGPGSWTFEDASISLDAVTISACEGTVQAADSNLWVELQPAPNPHSALPLFSVDGQETCVIEKMVQLPLEAGDLAHRRHRGIVELQVLGRVKDGAKGPAARITEHRMEIRFSSWDAGADLDLGHMNIIDRKETEEDEPVN